MAYNYGAKDYVKDYRVARDPAYTDEFRITNLRNGLLNKHVFLSRAAALDYARTLAAWHKVNKSPNGKARTKRGNKKFVKTYYASKSI